VTSADHAAEITPISLSCTGDTGTFRLGAGRARWARVEREGAPAASASQFSLASARAAAAEHRIEAWVGAFLASPGSDNAVLAAGLAKQRHWWLVPLQLPIADLHRLAGPERDATVPIAPQDWTHDVDDMESSLDEGWEPPPLLAQHCHGEFLLQDGNHRCEALARAGAQTAWVLVYFDDEAERDALAAELLRAPPRDEGR